MAPDATTLLTSQITAAAGIAYIISLAKNSPYLPWITQHTKFVNTAVRALLAGGAYLGIEHAWSGSVSAGGTLTIHIPPLAAMATGLWHWFGQYAMTHIAGNVIDQQQSQASGKQA